MNRFLLGITFILLLQGCGQINDEVLIPSETEYFFKNDAVRVMPPLIPLRETIERQNSVEFVQAHDRWDTYGLWSVKYIKNHLENTFSTLHWMEKGAMTHYIENEYAPFGFRFNQVLSDTHSRVQDRSIHEIILAADGADESAMMVMTAMRADNGDIVYVNLLYPLRDRIVGVDSKAKTLRMMHGILGQYRAFRDAVVIMNKEEKGYRGMVVGE